MKHISFICTVVLLNNLVTAFSDTARQNPSIIYPRQDVLDTLTTRDIVEELEFRLQRRASSAGTHKAPNTGKTTPDNPVNKPSPSHSGSSTGTHPGESSPPGSKPSHAAHPPDEEPNDTSSGESDGSPLFSINVDNSDDQSNTNVVNQTDSTSTGFDSSFDSSFDNPFGDDGMNLL